MACEKIKKFTLVSTIFNEALRLQDSIDDIEAQTVKPDEIVVVDAGSVDGTLDILNNWKKNSGISIKIIVKQRCNVAEGRNLAIEKSTNDIIVSTDFGCRYGINWLASMITPFNDSKVMVVGGNFTVKKDELKSIPSKTAYILNNGYSNHLDEKFIPSSRSIAYYKSVWMDVEKYPEELTLAGDDTMFGQKLRDKRFNIFIQPEPNVFWNRHNELKGYNNEAFRYGLGDGESRIDINKRNVIITTIEGLLRLLFIATILYAFYYGFSIYSLPLLSISLLGFRPYFIMIKRMYSIGIMKPSLPIFFYVFFMLESNRFYYLKGYLKGLFKK